MKRYEYRIGHLHELEQLGLDGWMLIAPVSGAATYIFARVCHPPKADIEDEVLSLSDKMDPIIGEGLSVRAMNALYHLGIDSWRVLARHGEGCFLPLKNVGQTTRNEITNALKDRGLSLSHVTRTDRNQGLCKVCVRTILKGEKRGPGGWPVWLYDVIRRAHAKK